MATIEKECFGILEKVFPIGQESLREVPPECFKCKERVACLRNAMSTEEGLEMREEAVDRAAAGGFMGAIQRWSKKKELSRLIEQQRKKKR